MASCKITPDPSSFSCPFKATTGPVTLGLTNVRGSVKFLRADYNGAPVSGTPSNQITFTIVSGTTDLDVIYTFTDTDHGEARLDEVCDGKNFMDEVHADDPPVTYRFCAP